MRLKILRIMIVFLIMLLPSGCAHRPTALEQSLDTLRALRSAYDNNIYYYNKSVQSWNDSYSSFDADCAAFNRALSNDQIDAQRNWVKYRNNETGSKYLESLSAEQMQAALDLEDRQKLLVKQRQDIKDHKVTLDRNWAEIEQFAVALQNTAQSEFRKDAIIEAGLWRLHDQTNRMSEQMMQRSRDLMLMRR
ncbi:MAG: hypothetical protein NT047_07500 [Deltaproteobacteria bacterium]|nr:hypothetical protein [Deltaproteobacteria bacterium]